MSIDTTEISTVTRNGCVFTVTPKNVQGASGFTVPYTSSAGGSVSGRIGLQVGPASTITFNAPSANPVVQAGGSVTLGVDNYASDGTYTISCGTVTESSALISISSQSGCDVTIAAGSTAGTATISVPYISSGGHTSTQSVSVDVIPASNITFSAPTGLKVGTNRTLVIDASDYVSETHASFTITCGNATSISTTYLMTVSRNGCEFTVTPTSTEGSASFVVPFTSTGGDTENGTINIEVGPASTITYEGPTGLQVGANRTQTIDASDYVTESHSGYGISCGDAINIDTTNLMTVARNGCVFTITPTAVEGPASFTVPFTSEGGHSTDGVVNITVGPHSEISFTDPQLTQGSNLLTLTINALDYITENMAYTVTCGAATSIDTTEITSVTQASAGSCSYTITLTGTAGASGFTIPYTSSGGHSESGAVTLTVGASSSISFNAPSALKVGRNQTLEIDASSYASDGSYTVSCGDATGVDADKMAVTHTGSSCTFMVDPVNNLAAGSQGDTTFSVPFTSSGGATATGTFTVNIGPDSSITYNAPTGLTVGRNQTLTIDASAYASDGGYTISCGDATSIDSTRLTSVSRTANTCSFTITPISTLSSSLQGDATFSVPFSSDGGATANGVVTVNVGPDSTLTFSAPTGLKVGRNRTLVIDASAHATEADSNNTISCGDATGVDASKMTVTRTGSSCTFTVDPVNNLAAGSQGDTTFSVPFTSTGGATASGTFTVNIGPDSTITWNSPGTLTVGRNRTRAIDASDYVSEVSGSGHTITCSDATAIDSTKLTSVARTANTCSYTITPITTLTPAQQGNATFTITFTSDGGHEITRTLTVNVGPDSTIVFAAPASNPAVAASRTRTIDVSSYATDGSYTISCGTITESDPDISLGTQDGCRIPIIAGSVSGQTADISIPYRSSGGHTTTGTLTLDVGAASSITFTAPTNLKVGTNRTQTINVLDYASDSGYTITCGTATNTAADMPTTGTVALASVVRDSSGNGCGYTITPTSTQGTATFTVPLTSDGGDSTNANISIEVGVASNIRYQGPSGLRIGRNLTLEIDASGYVSEAAGSGYAISCADATGADATKMTVTRTANSCTYTIDPVDSLAPADQGNTGFSVRFTSEGGHTIARTITVNIGPDSTITFADPGTFTLGRNRTLVIDALAATSGENAAYTVTCADATGVDATKMTVTRSSTGDRCSFTVDPVDTLAVGSQGDTTFTVAFSSTGGATASGTFTVNIGPDSTIVYTAPSGLLVGSNRSLTVDISAAATDGSYTVTCGDAASVHSRLSSVTRPDAQTSPCVFSVTPRATASQGTASFSVPFTSSGRATATGIVSLTVGPPSNISFTDPGLQVAINLTRTIDALDYVRDGNYAITCGDATGIDSTKLTTVARDSSGSGCGYTITPISTLTMSQQGSASFTIAYTSAGGHTLSQSISIQVGPTSAITYTPPPTSGAGRLQVAANRQLTIDASSYASEASSGYAISCGDAADINTGIDRIARTGCSYVVTPAAAGSATFTVPYVSQGGATENGTITIDIGAATNIVFTPPVGLRVAASSSVVVNAALYAADGTYAITCGDATGIDSARLASVSRTGCSFTAMSSASTGIARFTVPYTSAGGDTQNGLIAITIGPAPTASAIVFTAPQGLSVRAGSAITIDASRYAADSLNTIACGTATGVDTSKISVANTACSYTATATATATGTASFTVPYTSTGTLGSGSRNGTITISIMPASDIQFTSPTDLEIGAGSTRTLSLASYATDGPYSITCGNATATETAKLTSIARNGCDYTITAAATAAQGDTTFTLTYTSSGTDTHDASFTITIGPASSIVFTAPAAITFQASSARGIDLSSYATDGSYTIGCLDATNIDPKLSSVTRNGCTYTIAASATPGNASFTIGYTSTGGNTRKATIYITITPAPTRPEERPERPIIPPAEPTRRPTPPPPTTTTTTTTIPDPSRPTTTLEPDQPGPRWNTLTAQTGGTTPAQIRQAFNLGSSQTIYTWNANTQTWTRATRSSQAIPAGTRVSFRTEEAVTNREMRNSNLGGGTTRTRLTTGWNTLSIPQGITRTQDTDFLLDPSLTDCRNQQGIIAIASYSTRSRRWSISLPCHPAAQRRLTTGENAPYRPLASIAPADTTYIFTRTRQPLNIRWNKDTQTYQAFQSIFTR